jgi:hypothetical protein
MFQERDINNECLSQTYFDNIIFNELKFSRKYSDLLDQTVDETENLLKIYFIRLWVRKYDTYVYKIGSTTNIEKRMKQLNTYFDSCGRIIILFCAKINSVFCETYAHKILSDYRINDNIQNNIKSQSREIYDINNNVYDYFLNYIKTISQNNFFETSDYTIDDRNKETIVYYDQYQNLAEFSKVILEDYSNIKLDQSNNEDKYWKILRNYY